MNGKPEPEIVVAIKAFAKWNGRLGAEFDALFPWAILGLVCLSPAILLGFLAWVFASIGCWWAMTLSVIAALYAFISVVAIGISEGMGGYREDRATELYKWRMGR